VWLSSEVFLSDQAQIPEKNMGCFMSSFNDSEMMKIYQDFPHHKFCNDDVEMKLIYTDAAAKKVSCQPE
jgi:hypothetical protein